MENSLNRIIKTTYMSIYQNSSVAVKRKLNRFVRLGLNLRKMSFEIHLTEHCNLNCKGCDNFSPVAEKGYVDVDEYKKEMLQMRHIFGASGIAEIRLLGGEPLLHPRINKILFFTRRTFPKTKLTIITNGLLLPRMGDEFIKVCKRCQIQILVTRYPVNFDYDGILQELRNQGVECGTFNTEPVKTLFKKPLDPDGKQDGDKMFDLCMNANHCISLKDGRLYTCSTIPNASHLNKFFGCEFEISEGDYIDIFKDTNRKRIRRFLRHRMPFCRYCDIEHETFGIRWETSQKKRSEWM